MYDLYSTREFEEQYTYPGSDLGASWTRDKTVFRLWAPTAEEVLVNLYRSGDIHNDDRLDQLRMHRDVKGTWVSQRQGDLNGIYYTYLVSVEGHKKECCDPYARATGINGNRAMVIDLDSTDPKGWERDTDPHKGMSITDAVIYELHIRDLSMHRSGRIRHRGKYLGLTEANTSTKSGYPTGLAHMKNLGITHVHLLPVYDFGSSDESRRNPQYNWGYDPVNFNVPEGSYATNAHNGTVRVREFKQMVKALHDNGISIILDVVYNHVYNAGDFCFNQIVPGYFSRIDTNGIYSNGSCCGNDTASERSMVRKYIVDSVNYWADEYHIDGFRFDLVGLMDIQTLNEAIRTVHQRHPNVIFYGEGWRMNTQLTKPGYDLAIQSNSEKMPGMSFFSDSIRDLLRGSTFEHTAPGWVSGAQVDPQKLEENFMGMPQWASQPYQCINYVSCHDNNTLFDRLTLGAPEAPADTVIRMNRLAAAFSILAQGVPFLQAGEEILRSKPARKGRFDHNSYRSSDRVNSIKWEDLDKPEYQTTLEYYRGLIAFRKAHPCLRLRTRDQVNKAVHPIRYPNPHAIAFRIEDRTKELFLLFNADTREVTVPLPEGNWEIHVLGESAGTASLGKAAGSIQVPAISTLVVSRKKPIDVVAALIWEKDKFLICQRPADKTRGLLWEFVGGKAEPGETLTQALIRECAEELAITVEVGEPFMEVLHDYPDMLIRLTLFHCTIPTGRPQALEHNDIRWIHPSQADDFAFCPADIDILKEIKRQYENRQPL